MTKRLISFTPKSYVKLQAQAEKNQISVSELVRRIVDNHLENVNK